jgi:hypothetical protein
MIQDLRLDRKGGIQKLSTTYKKGIEALQDFLHSIDRAKGKKTECKLIVKNCV